MGASKYFNYLKNKAVELSHHELQEDREEIEEMEETQSYHKKFKDNNFFFEIIHSFSPSESQKLGSKKINELGQELAKRSFFSEHEYFIVTHTDKAHFHNHIIVNPVHPETGKRIYRDMKHRDVMMALNDKLCRENGLNVIEKTAIEKNEELHPKAKKMSQRYGQSYELDLMQKADFARAYSTNFFEYESILKEMNVDLRITEKTISYLYQGKQKRKRGDKIGKRYTKEGLQEKFKSNLELFSRDPQLKDEILQSLRGITDHQGNIVGTPSSVLLDGGGHEKFIQKGRHRFSKNEISHDRNVYSSDHHLHNSIVPLSIIREARNGNILKYAESNGIKTVVDSKGQTVLKGRPHVQLFDYEWVNTKNKTRGSLIDFVAFHDQSSYLKAIAKIADNPRLLLLEKHFGEVKRPYTSFHIPNLQEGKESEKNIRIFLKHHNASPQINHEIWRLKNVRSDKNGNVWFLPEKDRTGAIEYHQTDGGQWEKRKHGKCHSPFFQKTTKNREAVIFFDPMSFIKHKKAGDILAVSHGSNILALLDDDHRSLDLFLVRNSHVNSLFFAPKNGKEFSKHEIELIETLSQKYRHHDISIGKSSLDLDLTRKGKEFDISF